QWDFVDLSDRFNEQVTQIFKNRYYEPRPDAPTLQLPLQGIGNWTHPKVQPEIDDSGLRQRAGAKGRFSLENDIPFKTPRLSEGPNILFVSRWENYPNQVKLPLNGHARHMYLLMAGSTNFMQSRLENGTVIVSYKDGSRETLSLRNPTP